MTDTAKNTLVLAFDIYGTLLHTGSIYTGIQTHTSLPVEKAQQLSQLWRRYQLEYTWRLNSMGLYEPFDVVTKRSLQHAAAEVGVTLSEGAVSGLMDAYNHLAPFDDALPALKALSGLSHVKTVIFSNGTEEMVSTALHTWLPKTLLPIPLHFVGPVKRYKPAPEVYHGLLKDLGRSPRPASNSSVPDVWLVSGNPFDVMGARAAGLGAVWVDREGKGWMDQLPLNLAELGPMKIVRNLGEISAVFRDFA